jgi:hypothetical protein
MEKVGEYLSMVLREKNYFKMWKRKYVGNYCPKVVQHMKLLAGMEFISR